ncbi:MAG: hypothetical protein KBG29_10065 [Pseudomonadales bacterium]|nr:hypothetical protein [Pseudomonadales bacterium]
MSASRAVRALQLLLLGTIAPGCVFQEHYPSQWGELAPVRGDCADIRGVYSDWGHPDPNEVEEGMGGSRVSAFLSRQLIANWKEIGPPTHVEISQADDDTLTATAWEHNKKLAETTYRRSEGEFTCKSGFIALIGEYSCVMAEGVMACDKPEGHFRKSNDGALILKANSRGFGTVYIVPVIVSEWHWYRFERMPVE